MQSPNTQQDSSSKKAENMRKFSEAGIMAMRQRRQAGLERYWERKRKEREELEASGIKKRKVGRPKKKGRPKKRKSRAKQQIIQPKIKPQYNWKIIATTNGTQKEYFGKFCSLDDAFRELNRLHSLNAQVVFERKTINKQKLSDSKDEYILVEKNYLKKKPNIALRNEYGVLVEHKVADGRWIVIDKRERKVEETFWVYGFDPRGERKTFQWIYDNLLLGLISDKYDVIRIILYKNKVVILDNDNNPYMIICKTISDAVRFYNLIDERVKKNKVRQVFFMGAYNKASQKKKDLEAQLIQLTGWDLRKLQRHSTRS